MKAWIYRLLERVLSRYPLLIYWFLDRPPLREVFLRPFLLNRPHLLEAYFRWKPADQKARHVLILKPDAVGDFILFLPFLHALKSLPEMQDRPFVLVGNRIWADLARSWCADIFADVHFVDRAAFRNPADSRYRNQMVFDLNKIRVHTLVYPVHSRETLLGDWLVSLIPAVRKIASRGDTQCQNQEENQTGHSLYTHLYREERPYPFESDMHQALLEYAFPAFPARPRSQAPVEKNQAEYIAMFPGAGAALRQWPKESFREVAVWMAQTYQLEIRVLGGPDDVTIGEWLAEADARIQNRCGKTSLPELAQEVAGARLLLANETGVVHLAALTQTPTLCLSNGNHYGRFNPWAKHGAPHIVTLYPTDFQALTEENRLADAYHGSQRPMASISVENVIQALKKLGDLGG